MERRDLEFLLAELEDARDAVESLLAKMPKPPQRECDVDAIETLMREDVTYAFSSTDIASESSIPVYRVRAALALLVQKGVVVRSGTTRGTRYRLASATTGEHDPWPTGMG